MINLDNIAKAMYGSIKWGNQEIGWQHAPEGMQEHYLALAKVAVNMTSIPNKELEIMANDILDRLELCTYEDRTVIIFNYLHDRLTMIEVPTQHRG